MAECTRTNAKPNMTPRETDTIMGMWASIENMARIMNPQGGCHVGQQITGVASVYWTGRQTATGERYHPDNHRDLTIAHKHLPFNTIVKLEGPNGRVVYAHVNDRSPFVRGREFDSSRATAQEIGVDGLAIIRATIVKFS